METRLVPRAELATRVGVLELEREAFGEPIVLRWLLARAIHAALIDDYADIHALKEQLFDGVDDETFARLVERGKECKESL